MKTKIALIAVLLAIMVSAAASAADPDAVVSYADGTGFILVSEGNRTEYDIAADDVIGLPLETGDTILTDDGSFLEIQLLRGSGGVVKIAENTTFTVMDLDEGGGGVFRVTYGRIRVKVAALLGDSRVWVTGHDTVAGVRGTDFGYDLFYDKADDGGERQTAVYVFDGAVDVVRYDRETAGKIDPMEKEPFVLSSGKMVKTRSTAPDEKLKSTSIDAEILDYWNIHPFRSAAAVPVVQEEALEVAEELSFDTEPTGMKRDYQLGGKLLFTTGVGFTALSGIVRIFTPDDSMLYAGFLTIGLTGIGVGGGMVLYSLSLP